MLPPGLASCLAWSVPCCESQNGQPEGVLGPAGGCQPLLELCLVLRQAYKGDPPLLLLPIAAGRGGLSCAVLPGEDLQKVGNKESSKGFGCFGSLMPGLFLGGLPVVVPLLSLPVPSTVCSARPGAAAARRCCAVCPCERLSILVT